MSDQSKITLKWPLIDGILLKSDTTYLGPTNDRAMYIHEVYTRPNGQNTEVTKGIYSDGYRFIDMITGNKVFTLGYRPDGSINYTILPEEYKKHQETNVSIRKKGGNIKLIPKGAKGWYASEMQTWSPEKMKLILEQYGKEGLSSATYEYLVKRVGEPKIVTTQSSTMPQIGKTDNWGQNTISKIKDFFTNNANTKDEWNLGNNTVTINGKTYSTTDRNDITELQNYLINNGYNLGVSKGTGYFGNKTKQALTQYFNTNSSSQSNLLPVEISKETRDIRKLMGDLVNYSNNPYLKDTFAKIDQSSEFGNNDKEVIKLLQARYNIPVTGELDDATLERFKHENSFIGKVENVVESFNKPGSVGRLFSRAITQAILPEGWVKEKQLYRDDFTTTLQKQFDYILKRASLADPGVYSLSGALYSDGYAPGHYGADPNLIRRGFDILRGNDLQSGAFSIGGATVSTHIFPNGKRGSLLTDVYDFNNATPDYIVQQQNAIKNDPNLTELERALKLAELNTSVPAIEALIAKGLGNRNSTVTYYGLYEDGTPMTLEDIQWALSDRSNYPGKKRKDGSTYRPALANHADIDDLMYTTWTGSGNTYKGSTTSKEHPTVFSQIIGEAKDFWNTKIRKELIGGCLKYISK